MENTWQWVALFFATILVGYLIASGTSGKSVAGLINLPSQVANVPIGGLLGN